MKDLKRVQGIWVMLLTLSLASLLLSDEYGGPTDYFSRIRDPLSSIWQRHLPPFFLSNSNLNASIVCEPIYSRGLMGYPGSGGLMKGICDTVSIIVQFTNRSDSPYVFAGKTPSEWFMPELHHTIADIVHDTPVVDTTALYYATRTWTGILGNIPMPDTLHSKSPPVRLVYDVSDIPLGKWVVTLAPTNKAPTEIHINYNGCVIDCEIPDSGRDSVNAWLSLAERSGSLRDSTEMHSWITKSLQSYPTSVPAWWMLAVYHAHSGDSSKSYAAIDSALTILSEKRDSLLPDTSGQVTPDERLYLRALGYYLQSYKDGLGESGNW